MAEKQTKAKPKAKPDPKAELIVKPDMSVELEQVIEAPAAVPMNLIHSASDLAAMARAAKAGKGDMDDVIAEHDIYLSLVKMGAAAPAADVEFVKNHMKYLKTL